MPSRPDPPSGSQELAKYSVGGTVFCYRTKSVLFTVQNLNPAGKWRRGEVQSRDGSSTGHFCATQSLPNSIA